MGCDIHFVIEKKRRDKKWEGVHNGDHAPCIGSCWVSMRGLNERNYKFFASLAGVRGEGPDPKGLPDGVSDMAKSEYNDWSLYVHSVSWDTWKDFIDKHHRAQSDENLIEDAKRLVTEQELSAEENSKRYGCYDPSEYRVVYWFDN